MEPDIELAWNLRSAKNPADKLFRGGKPPPRSIVKQVNYVDNPFFPEALQDAAPAGFAVAASPVEPGQTDERAN